MKADVLLGLQWGDEGKGKIVDVLTPNYDVVARFQGGPNAGHSLVFQDSKHVLHTIPSGIFRKGTINMIGNGVVIDPVIFKDEAEKLLAHGIDLRDNLLISKKAHLILPTHQVLDAASEAAKGVTKIGSTLRGIGPTYMDKTGRNGLRVGDIISPKFHQRFDYLVTKHRKLLRQYDYQYDTAMLTAKFDEGIEYLKRFRLVDGEYEVNKYLQSGKRVLAEGAQGTLLDIDFGSYPYVTSSNTISAGVCTGLGIAPNKLGEIYGIFKAYCTRVGRGPFPTEQDNEVGQKLRDSGGEYGATTGRPRRCGWLDMVALKYAIMVNGITKLIMSKADVLSHFGEIKVATAYKTRDQQYHDRIPFDLESDDVVPVYETFKGWKMSNLDTSKGYEGLPQELKDYIRYIEEETGVPIAIVSVGPDRRETIMKPVA